MLRVGVEEVEAVAVRVNSEAVMLIVMYLCLTHLPTRRHGARNRHHLHHENHRVEDHDHRLHRHHHPLREHLDVDLILDLSLSLRTVLKAMMS